MSDETMKDVALPDNVAFAFDALRDPDTAFICLAGLVNGNPAGIICAANPDESDKTGESMVFSPLFVSVTPDMVIEHGRFGANTTLHSLDLWNGRI